MVRVLRSETRSRSKKRYVRPPVLITSGFVIALGSSYNMTPLFFVEINLYAPAWLASPLLEAPPRTTSPPAMLLPVAVPKETQPFTGAEMPNLILSLSSLCAYSRTPCPTSIVQLKELVSTSSDTAAARRTVFWSAIWHLESTVLPAATTVVEIAPWPKTVEESWTTVAVNTTSPSAGGVHGTNTILFDALLDCVTHSSITCCFAPSATV
mmetsp:Transcript_53949/g.115755  ORF Transcript_53949/g.115755 Transcript_53949/m.115755 type:complete len:210 (-) Transcript_53949:170-799(-)